MDVSQKHSAKREKLDTKEGILHDSTYITFWNRQNYRNTYQIQNGGRGLTTEGHTKFSV